MARGLSQLQKSILITAYRNRDGSYEFGHVKNHEVLKGFYGFPAHTPKPGHVSGSPQMFNRQQIGISRYRAACVSTVKSFDRLSERGLAEREKNHGIILTEEGFKVAKIIDREVTNDRRKRNPRKISV
jgi:hypothetical protein